MNDEPAFYTVAVYLVDKAYGGGEEGGWWYDCGELVKNPEEYGGGIPRTFENLELAQNYRTGLQKQLDEGVNKGRRPISSVISTGRYEAQICDGYPEPYYPATRPHYE